MSERPPGGYQFRGFHRPRYTIVPDDLFDELLPELTEAELKVLLYVIRRTFGFKKDSDDISIKQIVDGIVTADGRRLDRGTGVSRSTASRAIAGLVDKGIVVARRNRSEARGDQPTTYELRFADDPRALSQSTGGTYDRTPPSPTVEHARALRRDPQETVNQETVDNMVGDDWKVRLAETMTPANFARWIAPLQLIERADGDAVLRAPDATVADYVEKRLADRLAGALGVGRVEVRSGEPSGRG